MCTMRAGTSIMMKLLNKTHLDSLPVGSTLTVRICPSITSKVTTLWLELLSTEFKSSLSHLIVIHNLISRKKTYKFNRIILRSKIAVNLIKLRVLKS